MMLQVVEKTALIDQIIKLIDLLIKMKLVSVIFTEIFGEYYEQNPANKIPHGQNPELDKVLDWTKFLMFTKVVTINILKPDSHRRRYRIK